jgi:hypothetical protein
MKFAAALATLAVAAIAQGVDYADAGEENWDGLYNQRSYGGQQRGYGG